MALCLTCRAAEGQPHVVWGLASRPNHSSPTIPDPPLRRGGNEINRSRPLWRADLTTGATLEQARQGNLVLHFVGQMPLAGHRLAGDALSARPATARLRGLVYRGWRGKPLRSPRCQRHDGMRIQCRLSAAGDGEPWARRPLGLLGRDPRCMARAAARTRAAALSRGGRADKPVRRHAGCARSIWPARSAS